MTNPDFKPDFKIAEYFSVDDMKVRFNVIKRAPNGDYFFVKRFDDLESAKDCVRMLRKYKNIITHYVED